MIRLPPMILFGRASVPASRGTLSGRASVPTSRDFRKCLGLWGHSPSPEPARAAFTMIEMIGILAVLGILAAVILSTTGRSLTLAAASQETTNLVNYSTALQNNILRNRYIPGPYTNDWATHIATELGVNVSSVATNAWNNPRYFLIDPTIQIAPNAQGVLPYDQSSLVPAIATTGQANQPANARVMIVTSLSSSPSMQFPSFVTSGTPTSANFNNLWNWTDQSLNAPSDWPTSWNNRGTALLVQRINLAPLFVHLTLQNYPPPPLSSIQGQYTIDRLTTSATYPVPTNGVNAYLLKNTVLSLFRMRRPMHRPKRTRCLAGTPASFTSSKSGGGRLPTARTSFRRRKLPRSEAPF